MSLLEVSNVSKSFGETHVLRGVDIQVESSQVVVLIGPSGSGKSTLLRCINGLEAIDAGKVILDGRYLPARATHLRAWREQIGFVFQSFNLFPHLTASDNIALPLRLVKGVSKSDARRTARSLLAQVGISAQAGSYANEMSGGQQQRVAIARALALNPTVMLFDEPTSALDPELTGEVIDVMVNLAREGMTMLVVSHEMRFVREVADQIYFLQGGTVRESGTADKIFSAPETAECRRFIKSIVG